MDLNLIDALPYIDTLLERDQGLREKVEAMIEQELPGVKKDIDYGSLIGDVPNPSFGGSTFLQAEYERVSKKGVLAMESDLELEKTVILEDKELKKQNLVDLERRMKELKANIENENTRLVNLELLKKFGTSAFKVQTNVNEKQLAMLQHKAKLLEKHSVSINKKRKIRQLNAGLELDNLQQYFLETGKKNEEIRSTLKALHP